MTAHETQTEDVRDRGLPTEFPPAEKSYALYENVDYQDHWRDRGHQRQDALERHILAEMLPARGRRILDLGGGYGRLAPVYLDRFEQSVLYDGSLSLLRDARKTLRDRVVTVAGDVGRLPFRAGAFDCVLSIRVLQHVHELEGALAELRRVMAGGGSVVFSYHNKRNANRVLRYYETRNHGNPFKLESEEIGPTLVTHHPDRVATIMSETGFSEPVYEGTVVNPLASMTERLGAGRPSGAAWAPLLGKAKLAPWLIGRAEALGETRLLEASAVSDLFACPVCHEAVFASAGGYECPECGRAYPVSDGIADFRV